MPNPNGQTPSPNIGLLDFLDRVWSLKTIDDGSGNQSISVSLGDNGNFTPGQATIGTTPTLIAAARSGRQSITVTNTGTTAVYLGGSGVTTTTGAYLPGVVGATITIPFSGALYGIVASGTQLVTEYETY